MNFAPIPDHTQDYLPYLVYGTLRRGEYNHKHIAPYADYLTTIRINGYRMLTNGGFPYAVPGDESESIVVEAYIPVDGKEQAAMRSLDSLEGFRGPNAPRNHYNREAVRVTIGRYTVWAWLYVANGTFGNLWDVPTGDWKDAA